MIIDSHAHLLYFKDDVDRIVANMQADGLERIVNIGTTAQNSREGLELANKYEKVYAAVGIYPEYAKDVTDSDLEEIDRLAGEEKVVAIGEIGLDYHNGEQDKEAQKRVFEKQIMIAKKHNLPICIHTRAAAEDTYQILKAHKDDIVVPSIMHCFSENGEYAKKFMDLGFYISFSGNITYKKSDRSFLKDLPLDKIILETDSPYLSPMPLRGMINQPSHIIHTAQKIADVLEMDVDELTKHTTANTYRVYKKMR